MALGPNGPLTIGNIRNELQNTGTNSFSLKNAGGYTGRDTPYVPTNQSSPAKPSQPSPYQVSEWYNYNHSAALSCSPFFVNSQTVISNYIYYKATVNGCTGQVGSIVINLLDPNIYTHRVLIYSSYPFNNVGTIIIPTPIFNDTIDINAPETTFIYTLSSTSNDFHIVMWNEDIL